MRDSVSPPPGAAAAPPQHLLCPISGQLFEDPVIVVESGQTALQAPQKTKRPFWEELNFVADTFKVQSDILQGQAVAGGNYLLQDTILIGDPQLAMQVRKLLQPAFTAEQVNRQLPRIQALAEHYCSGWARAGQVQDLQEQLKLFTFDVICSVVFGFDWSPQELSHMSGLFGKLVQGISFPITLDVPFTPFGQAMAARRQIVQQLQQQIATYRHNASTSAVSSSAGPATTSQQDHQAPPPPTALLHTLLQTIDSTHDAISDAQLLDILVSLLVAGHDTTSSTLGVALYYLGTLPAVAEKMRQEQLQLMAKHGPAVTPAYAFLREVWRLHPIVPVAGRVTSKTIQLGNYQLPAQQPIMVALNYIMSSDPRWPRSPPGTTTGFITPASTLGSHHASSSTSTASTTNPPTMPTTPVTPSELPPAEVSSSILPAPEGIIDTVAVPTMFEPEHFSPERFLQGPTGAAIGSQLVFGAGARRCLGEGLALADARLFLAVLVRSFSFELAPGSEIAGFPFPQANVSCRVFTEQQQL
eukprot:gene10240-10399_t